MPTATLNSNQVGFHYYPDTEHYTNQDLVTCVKYLRELKASWLVLESETSRAIPENFINGLISTGIKPIIRLSPSLPSTLNAADLRAILQAYARWGVKYIVLFDRPNDRNSWSTSGWSQTNLVESFLDFFVPLANECLDAGLTPVFPPLTPGGSFWDLSFFTLVLNSLQRRGQKNLLNQLILGVYACTFNHAADWGVGGAAAWPHNRPYLTPADSQDQIGLNQYVWLEEIAQKILGKPLPLILFGLDRNSFENIQDASSNLSPQHIQEIQAALTQNLQQQNFPLLAGNFWLLQTTQNEPELPYAWVNPDGSTTPSYQVISGIGLAEGKSQPQNSDQHPHAYEPLEAESKSEHPIQHYLLLPKYDWGVADWHLTVIRPFVLKHQPTIGFSLTEAKFAQKVTVIGGESSFPESDLIDLRKAGCIVERISGDGTSIATQLAER